ncbi:MAG: EF-hand domain-containing protein [Victivallales bacterium]|jgi:hypothetical protein
MRMTKCFLAAVVVLSFFSTDLISAEDFPRGGFMVGRLAAKRLKKMREQENFSGADQNKDGKLDRQEVESAKKAHGNFIGEETFKKIDTNGDGMLSHDECEKFQKETEKAESKLKPDAKPETNMNKDVKN